MKTLFTLALVLSIAGLSACKQKPSDAPAPVVEQPAAPAAPAAPEDLNATNPAEAEGAVPAAPQGK